MEGAKNGALRDPGLRCLPIREMTIHHNALFSSGKIIFQPAKDVTIYAQELELVEEALVPNLVKGL